jgi:NTP pyrophosphatase (non-canonical NTP hydrolase)
MAIEEDYVQLAIRTESPIAQIPSTLNMRVFHASLGICTEVGELFSNLNIEDEDLHAINLVEELGDLCWYLALACDALKLDFKGHITRIDLPIYEYECVIDNLVIESSNLLDLFKKSIFYRKEFNLTIACKTILTIIDLVVSIADENDLNISNILERNIAKLSARYPDRFTEYYAINRDLDAEDHELRKDQYSE